MCLKFFRESGGYFASASMGYTKDNYLATAFII